MTPLTRDYKRGFGSHKRHLWATLKPVGQTLILQLSPRTDGDAEGEGLSDSEGEADSDAACPLRGTKWTGARERYG